MNEYELMMMLMMGVEWMRNDFDDDTIMRDCDWWNDGHV